MALVYLFVTIYIQFRVKLCRKAYSELIINLSEWIDFFVPLNVVIQLFIQFPLELFIFHYHLGWATN